ncbi:RNA polymerase sigma factor [Phycicoccus sonneratiae]|uniref:Sigma-70 family RNA polymerase sigma factor n=1 Tax=Phycicoccus sonneratiae TaxID=2807628 RepID=A0ABS2CRT1_9MICO|nr:sigma-70 family RNA polymerase sigma factor [Phycicoccus sonneraticus]MBM6402586.1 sigma-70 family RNA polymerase sigma factor [Phycicoccus sonneraticus]
MGVEVVQEGPATARLGDEEFARWAEGAGTRLLRLAHALTGRRADAEDLTQDTLVRVGLAWHRLRAGEEPFPYARRTMVNLYLNGRRRHGLWQRLVPRLATETQGPRPDADDGLASARALLDRLPPRQRAAVALRYLLDLDDPAIAAALGCSEATVRSHVSRGLATLRAGLAPTPDPGEDP